MPAHACAASCIAGSSSAPAAHLRCVLPGVRTDTVRSTARGGGGWLSFSCGSFTASRHRRPTPSSRGGERRRGLGEADWAAGGGRRGAASWSKGEIMRQAGRRGGRLWRRTVAWRQGSSTRWRWLVELQPRHGELGLRSGATSINRWKLGLRQPDPGHHVPRRRELGLHPGATSVNRWKLGLRLPHPGHHVLRRRGHHG